MDLYVCHGLLGGAPALNQGSNQHMQGHLAPASFLVRGCRGMRADMRYMFVDRSVH